MSGRKRISWSAGIEFTTFEPMSQCRVHAFVNAEGDAEIRAHLHASLGSTRHLTRSQIASKWSLGIADVRPFLEEAGGVRYAIKDLSDRHDIRYPLR